MPVYVNDEKIEESEIREEAERLRPHYEQMVAGDLEPEQREKQLLEWSRENVIERALMRQAAARDPEEVAEETLEQAYAALLEQHGGPEQFFERFGLTEDREAEVKRDIEQRLRIERLMDRVAAGAPEPTEEDMRSFYDQNIERFTEPEAVRAAHIVKHTGPDAAVEAIQEEMRQLLKKLRNNADFGKLAGEHSDCPDNQGDLGTFPRGQMVEAFDEVVFALEPGKVSDVFETEFGFHIAKVHERMPARVHAFDEVREAIAQEFPRESRQKAIESFLDAEKDRADIREEPAPEAEAES